jgi:hypothetical protein
MQLTPRQKALWIIFILALFIAGLAIWYFGFRDQCDQDNPGYTKKGKLSDKCAAKVHQPVTPPPSGVPNWIPEFFPLRKGMVGPKISTLQKALGIATNGEFDSQTESAVYTKFKTNDVSESQYNSLINATPPPLGGQNFSELKKALGNKGINVSGGISTVVQGENVNYGFTFYASNGRVIIQKTQGQFLKKGSYHKGGKNIVIDEKDGGYESDESNVFSAMKSIVNQIEGK